MSFQERAGSAREALSRQVDRLIRPEEKDLGEFTVRRVLPAPERKMVGPFIFFDHMGPAEFPPGQGIQVRPHPHIGIATITYLFEGEILHADSLGYRQPIEAGAVNLMTAGRGIVHSERAGSDFDVVSRLHGIQSWMALPDEHEEIAPAFAHTPASDIPEIEQGGATTRIIMGAAYGKTSPVTTYSPTLYLHCRLTAGAELTLPSDYEELAFYVVSGRVGVGTTEVSSGVMMTACPKIAVTLCASEDACVMVIGGAPVGERHITWNFVSSSRERIDDAKRQWRAGGFDRIEGDDEFIPLPK